MKKAFLAVAVGSMLLVGCTTTNQAVLGTTKSQVQLRSFQSRAYDTTDKGLVLRSVVSTMQDLGFIIDKADETLGSVSGTNYTHPVNKLTVTVRNNKEKKQIIVRANGQVGVDAIENPKAYQNFFNALSQSLFLEAHNVE